MMQKLLSFGLNLVIAFVVVMIYFVVTAEPNQWHQVQPKHSKGIVYEI